jgi:hypothetical protein
MPTDVPKDDLKVALRALARLLAPYLVEEFHNLGLAQSEDPSPPRRRRERRYDLNLAAQFADELPADVAARALVFFTALSKPPHRVDSTGLAKWLGAEPREISGLLTTPLKRTAERLGLKGDLPWEVTERTRTRTVWGDRDGIAATMRDALKTAVARHREALNLDAQRPVPSAVFVWQPKWAHGLKTGADGSSTLRDSGPGTRAVIYRSHEDQAIVAMFDVGEDPEEDPDWRWYADGWIHVLPKPIPREQLLSSPELERVFSHLQGRRRLPASAQQALLPLLEAQYADHELPLFKGTLGVRR